MLIKISGSFRVFRGGSWDYSAYNCEVTYRYDSDPFRRINDIGFRVLRRCVYVNKN